MKPIKRYFGEIEGLTPPSSWGWGGFWKERDFTEIKYKWRYDFQHNDTQHNDTHYKSPQLIDFHHETT
jgi:hypothetical protein